MEIEEHVEDPLGLIFGSRIIKAVARYLDLADVKSARLACKPFSKWFLSYMTTNYFFQYEEERVHTMMGDKIYSEQVQRLKVCNFNGSEVWKQWPITHLKDIGVSALNDSIVFPETLVDIDLWFDSTCELPKDFLPRSLHTVRLCGYFNQAIGGLLPPFLRVLGLGDGFDQPIDDIPGTITHLHLGNAFDRPLDNLSPALVWLRFGTKFNQSIDKLPPNLRHLRLGSSFNKPVDHLPSTLTWLKFGLNFNQSVDQLPIDLTYLEFGWCFDQKVDRLPPNLTRLKLGFNFNHPVDNLPNNLKHLQIRSVTSTACRFRQSLNNLPPSLVSLQVFSQFNSSVDQLPVTLKKLVLFGAFNQPVDHLPPTLTHLSLKGNFNKPIDQLPSTLTHLAVNGSAFGNDCDSLPSSIEVLVLHPRYVRLGKALKLYEGCTTVDVFS